MKILSLFCIFLEYPNRYFPIYSKTNPDEAAAGFMSKKAVCAVNVWLGQP